MDHINIATITNKTAEDKHYPVFERLHPKDKLGSRNPYQRLFNGFVASYQKSLSLQMVLLSYKIQRHIILLPNQYHPPKRHMPYLHQQVEVSMTTLGTLKNNSLTDNRPPLNSSDMKPFANQRKIQLPKSPLGHPESNPVEMFMKPLGKP